MDRLDLEVGVDVDAPDDRLGLATWHGQHEDPRSRAEPTLEPKLRIAGVLGLE